MLGKNILLNVGLFIMLISSELVADAMPAPKKGKSHKISKPKGPKEPKSSNTKKPGSDPAPASKGSSASKAPESASASVPDAAPAAKAPQTPPASKGPDASAAKAPESAKVDPASKAPESSSANGYKKYLKPVGLAAAGLGAAALLSNPQTGGAITDLAGNPVVAAGLNNVAPGIGDQAQQLVGLANAKTPTGIVEPAAMAQPAMVAPVQPAAIAQPVQIPAVAQAQPAIVAPVQPAAIAQPVQIPAVAQAQPDVAAEEQVESATRANTVLEEPTKSSMHPFTAPESMIIETGVFDKHQPLLADSLDSERSDMPIIEPTL